MTAETQTASPAEQYIRDFRAAGGRISTRAGEVTHDWGGSPGASKIHRDAMIANPGDDFGLHVRLALEAELA
jgi:hypothetical protein